MSNRPAFSIVVLLIFSLLGSSMAGQVNKPHQHATDGKPQPESRKETNAQEKRSDKDQPQKAPAKKVEEPPERPLELVLFLNDVRSAPPEFAADLLLRAAESSQVADPAWKRELTEEAFRLAPTVQHPIKRIKLSSGPSDTRAGFLSQAHALNFDTISLQCRAVTAMLMVDKQKARELFSQIARPRLQPLDCQDALIYDVSGFYAILKTLAETAFTKDEIKRREPARLVEFYVGQVASPVEVSPVMEMIASIKLSPSERESLLSVFSKALSGVSGDDPSFSQSLFFVARAIRKLVVGCLQQGIPLDDLLRAYRTYLIRHLSAARCADCWSIFSRQELSTQIIDVFNKDLRPNATKNIVEIAADEIKPAKLEGTINDHEHWQSPKAARLLIKAKELRFGSGRTRLTTAERETSEWQDQVNDFLKAMSDWKKEDEETAEDYFLQKCVLFAGVIRLTPKLNLRVEVIKSYMEFLNSFDLARGNRMEWFWQARSLFRDVYDYNSEEGYDPARVIKQSELLAIIGLTKNPILYLYVQADKLLPNARLQN